MFLEEITCCSTTIVRHFVVVAIRNAFQSSLSAPPSNVHVSLHHGLDIVRSQHGPVYQAGSIEQCTDPIWDCT